ncbi:unnamed protein product [Heligmosomoides polygyrus]|uniref:Phorbol-ester/DAG-type domain-containing protein n=1 Tax=Heligmosomoides polygyrus TaxID=6339 RepID=A0A183GFZ7_HELPZ|nr:unnamed protein product [Heligmosomoides polygyrus]
METKMLRWTAGVTHMDRIRNDAIRQKFGAARIADKMRETRLRWYGHVLRGKEDSVRKIGLELEVSVSRPRARPKQHWSDALHTDMKVGEEMMFRALENIIGSSSDFDSFDMRTQAIVASLATIIRVVLGPKPSTTPWEKIMERCPQFIMKDRGGKSRKPPNSLKTKAQVKGHMFVVNPVNTVHYCYQCRDAIWGMQPWCYFCGNCDVKVHTQCTSSLTDACYPATQGKHKSKVDSYDSAQERPNQYANFLKPHFFISSFSFTRNCLNHSLTLLHSLIVCEIVGVG